MSANKSYISLYNLFYIFACIVWQPFQIYILNVDGSGRTIMIMSFLAIGLNLLEFRRQKDLFSSPFFICWVVLICYSMLNAFYKGFNAEYGTFKFVRDNFFDSFVLLVIMMLELKRNKYTCLWLVWIALGVYLLIGLPSFIEYFDKRFSVGGIGNLYPLHVVAFLFVSCILFVEEELGIWFLVMIAVGGSVIIFMSGTRKAFGAEVILLLGVVLNNEKKRDVGDWLRLVFYIGVLAVGVYFVMNHTTVGERIQEGTENYLYVQLVENNKVNDFLMSLLGDRAIQYESALELYHGHFWTGIGLTNFKDMSEMELVLHSEYMVQLCENGIIGFVLLMLFYVLLTIGLLKNREYDKRKVNMALFGLGSILFISFTSWTYNMKYIMVIYALLFMYASSEDEYDEEDDEEEDDFSDDEMDETVNNENSQLTQRGQFHQALDYNFWRDTK